MPVIQEALYSPFFNQSPITTTALTLLLPAPGTGLKYNITDVSITNAHASVGTVVQLRSGSNTIVDQWYMGPGKDRDIGFAIPAFTGANEALNAVCLTTGASVYITGKAFISRSTGTAGGQQPAQPAYSPADYFTGATIGFSYLFDTPGNNILNGAGTAATDGQTVATVKSSVVTADATQGTDASRPVLRTNAINTSMSVIELDGADLLSNSSLDAFLDSATSATIGVVWNPTDFLANHILYEVDGGTGNTRLQGKGNGAQTAIDYNPNNTANGNDQYSGGSNLLTAGVYSAVLWQVDATNRTVAMYANNATYKAPTVVTGPAQSWQVGGGNSSRLFRNSKGRCAHIFLAKNALMTTQQRADWFAAMKARYNLTAY